MAFSKPQRASNSLTNPNSYIQIISSLVLMEQQQMQSTFFLSIAESGLKLSWRNSRLDGQETSQKFAELTKL